MKCILCRKPITADNGSREHLVPNAHRRALETDVIAAFNLQ